jgi:molecular chaperone Hsp33
VRGTIDWNAEPKGTLEQYSLPELFQDGHLAITIEPEKEGDRYQGIVDLGERGLKEALEGYFHNSEQLETQLWLAADDKIAAGLLIQQMPAKQSRETDKDIWNRVQKLSETITDGELLTLAPTEVLHRLFHEENVRVFEPEVVSFRCSCSKERIATVLRGMGYQEVKELLEQETSISVDCQFCRQNYQFDAVDVEQIFAADISPTVGKTKH